MSLDKETKSRMIIFSFPITFARIRYFNYRALRFRETRHASATCCQRIEDDSTFISSSSLVYSRLSAMNIINERRLRKGGGGGPTRRELAAS